MTEGKLLFLARSFPPAENVASLRTKYFTKHLLKTGWSVTVVTVDPIHTNTGNPSEQTLRFLRTKGLNCVLTDHDLRFLTSGLLHQTGFMCRPMPGGIARRLAQFLDIDPGFGWIRPVLEACSKLDGDRWDAVMASGPPFAAFVAASRLAARRKTSLVLDYRDLWHTSVFRKRQTRFYTRITEQRIIDQADMVSVVSPTLAQILDDRYHAGRKIHVLTNGYDMDDLAAATPYPFDHFAMVYCGSLHPPVQNLNPIFELIRLAVDRCPDMKDMMFHYYGRESQYVRQEAQRHGVASNVTVHGTVSRGEAFSAIKGADLAVVLTAFDTRRTNEARGVITGKLFETMGLNTPVLLISLKGADAERIVEETGCGRAFEPGHTRKMLEYILELKNAGDRPALSFAARKYEWKSIILEFSRALGDCIAGNHKTEG